MTDDEQIAAAEEALSQMENGMARLSVVYYRYWHCEAKAQGLTPGDGCDADFSHFGWSCGWHWRGPELTDHQVALMLSNLPRRQGDPQARTQAQGPGSLDGAGAEHQRRGRPTAQGN